MTSTPSLPETPFVQRYGGRPFGDATVEDVMMNGVVTCRPETSLIDAARIMTGYGIHCLVLRYGAHDSASSRWGMLSDLDLVARAGSGDTAGQAARTDVVPVASNMPLEEAARRMVKYGVQHLLVTEPHSTHPTGVVSTLGIARAVAATREQKEHR